MNIQQQRTVGVAGDYELIYVVNLAAKHLSRAGGPTSVDVVSVAADPRNWHQYDAIIYDENDVGNDTVEALECLDSLFVATDELLGEDQHDVLANIERFLSQLSDSGDAD